MRPCDNLARDVRLAGRYVLGEAIGRGRSSTVYKAFDVEARADVALKVLDPFLVRDPVSVERFRREVAILRALQHPNVVTVYDLVHDGDLLMISMEYVPGEDAKTRLLRAGPLSMTEFLAVAGAVAAAVAACHRKRILHRDLKPQNILIEPETVGSAPADRGVGSAIADRSMAIADRTVGSALAGRTDRCRVKVVDFGIATMDSFSDLTRTGTVIGTPEYMAPELFDSARPDPRSDVYSLGAVFYELLAGAPPFPAGALAAVHARQRWGDLEPLTNIRSDVPPWVAHVVQRCLEADPARRFQSADELVAELGRGAGERKRAAATTRPPLCLHCGGERLGDLAFCHLCGTFVRDAYESGSCAVIVSRCEDEPALREYLVRTFGERGAPTPDRPLPKLPAVLVKGVSRETAVAIVGDLASVPCEVHATDRVWTQLPLRATDVTLALVPILPLWWNKGDFTYPQIATVVIGAQAVAALSYMSRSRPIVRLSGARAAARAHLDRLAIDFAARFKALSDPALKTALAHAVARYLSLRLYLSRSAVDPERVARILGNGFDVAKKVEEYDLYLAAHTLHDLSGRLEAAEIRLRAARGTAAVEELLAVRENLRADVNAYRETRDRHARAYLSVLMLNSLVQRLADSVGGGIAAKEMNSELAAMERDCEEVCGER